jgi:ribosomal protein S17E
MVQGKNLVEFGWGSFDEWCVFLTRPGTPKYAPKDTEYFALLKNKGNRFGHAKIYNDFISYYNQTTKDIDNTILDLITTLSNDYEEEAEEIDIWFTVIYAGMIAEENKANAILKKRIKRLGMHQVLLENYDPELAANFSKGKKWQELDKVMREKGF